MRSAICVGVADVRLEPDDSSELVTQALLGAQAEPGPACDGWQQVQLVDYAGWVRAAHLASASIQRCERSGDRRNSPGRATLPDSRR